MLRPIDRKGESVARSVLLSSVSCVCECGVGYSVSVTVHGDLLARDWNRNASRKSEVATYGDMFVCRER